MIKDKMIGALIILSLIILSFFQAGKFNFRLGAEITEILLWK